MERASPAGSISWADTFSRLHGEASLNGLVMLRFSGLARFESIT